jgi:acetyl-CoA C-acetyltransferase
VELLAYESFGLCPPGQAPKYIEAGYFDAEGAMPVNTDGGLKCFGHPVGVTGLKSIYEPYLQVTGQAEARQLRNVRLTAGHAQGGTSASSSVVTILGARD